MNAVTPASFDAVAVSPAMLTKITPTWCGTLSHPADFSIASRVRRSDNDSGSLNTANPKFCPANFFSAAMTFSWSSGAMVLGSFSLASSSCAFEATAFASAARSSAPAIWDSSFARARRSDSAIFIALAAAVSASAIWIWDSGLVLFQFAFFVGSDPRGQMVDRKRRGGDDPHGNHVDYVRPL